ncbi:phage regulatory CII family protein [Escherichia coli]|nr:phage regulatory CII family protein [Escherichia coli]
MFDYQVSKHPHFDEACRAFALRHNLVQLAERAGMNVQILRNKLNPAQPHLLMRGDCAVFYTITCPSRFHSTLNNGRPNPTWTNATVSPLCWTTA